MKMSNERTLGWRANKGPQAENKSGFRACGHRVLLLGEQKSEKTVGGIIIPQSAQDKEQQHQVWATVVEIGYDCWTDKSTDFCDVGDKVLVGQYTGKFHDSIVDGKTYRFVQDLDVITPLVQFSD
jgi:co-chaperonin GroES (HSP10)